MRVLLTGKFDWPVPGKRAWVEFNPGEHVMTRQQAIDAVAAGKGAIIKKKAADDGQPIPD